MQLKYLGPRDAVWVAPYGEHVRGGIVDYPDAFAADLIATSRRQQFAVVGAERRDNVKSAAEAMAHAAEDPDLQLALAAKMAIDEGNVTRSGKPTVEAMSEILDRGLTAAERDRAVRLIAAYARSLPAGERCGTDEKE